MSYDLPPWAYSAELPEHGQTRASLAEDLLGSRRTATATVERPSAPSVIRAATTEERSGNELRPTTFSEIVGQETAKAHLRRFVAAATRKGKPLAHCLFVGPSGTGKTTFAHVCAHELGARVFQLEAPGAADGDA
jgi:AAA+ superfamily predicted ATPase